MFPFKANRANTLVIMRRHKRSIIFALQALASDTRQAGAFVDVDLAPVARDSGTVFRCARPASTGRAFGAFKTVVAFSAI